MTTQQRSGVRWADGRPGRLRRQAVVAWLLGVSMTALMSQGPKAQTWGPLQWNFPATTSGVFQCIQVFPRPGDDGQAESVTTCPLQRASGVFGFTDPMGPQAPTTTGSTSCAAGATGSS